MVHTGNLRPTPSIPNIRKWEMSRASRGRIARCALLALLSAASACVIDPLSDEKSGAADGARCNENEDCRSGRCQENKLCAHSLCDCPGDSCAEGGEKSADCSSGWLCVYYSSIIGDIGEVFGVDHDLDAGSCQPLCSAGCPAHYTCQGGTFCAADWYWAHPIPTIRWTGCAEGSLTGREQQTQVSLAVGCEVMLSAEADSPVDMPMTYEWTLSNWSGETMQVEGKTATFVLGENDSSGRADLRVRDSDSRDGTISVSFARQ